MHARSTHSPAQICPLGRPVRVLIADGYPDAADSLDTLLELLGYEVTVAYDGPEALRRAVSCRPDVAVLDLALPRLNGYDVVRRLRCQPQFGATLFVAFTGYGREQDRQAARDAGFDHLLLKTDLDALHSLLGSANRRTGPPDGPLGRRTPPEDEPSRGASVRRARGGPTMPDQPDSRSSAAITRDRFLAFTAADAALAEADWERSWRRPLPGLGRRADHD